MIQQRSGKIRRVGRVVAWSLLGLLTFAGAGWGGWRIWFTHRPQPAPAHETLFRGVEYWQKVRRQTPRPLVVQVVRIDLLTPGLRFGVTSGDATKALPLRAQTTSAYLAQTGASLAINADFFYPWWSHTLWDYYPHKGDPVTVEGHACADGVCYVAEPARAHFPTLALSRDNRAVIYDGVPPPSNKAPRWNVVSGNRVLLRGGKTVCPSGGELNPRTAVALDRTGRYLVLLLVDGRQPNYSEGVTETELADLLRAEGGWDAINLDGGGSTTLAVRRHPESPVTVLNCPIDNYVPGRERNVANHLVLRATPP